jgi:CheY-like chemotaxis protein
MKKCEAPGKSILLVEDNPDDAELVLRALRKHDVCIPLVIARDGVEALNYLLKDGISPSPSGKMQPNLVLLDLKLPRVDGLEVLRQLRQNERTALLPIVILTSSTEESDILSCYRLHANSYVCKPVDYLQFAQIIQQIINYWLFINKEPSASRATA